MDHDALLQASIQRLEQVILCYEQKLKEQPEDDAALWNTADIADYLKLSYKYTNEYITTHINFPKPVRVPTKKSKQHCRPRWYRKDVLDWARRYKTK
ncbi:hypothetical protein EYS14_02365 [Alteromonadaceae bacterium M269]|nr:hypothetical protein EYS14_02365 [Alteromonadaceae bacterium M269]